MLSGGRCSSADRVMGMAEMTGMYVYCFCAASEVALVLPQGVNRQTEWIGVSGLGAIAESDLDLEALQADNDQLMAAVLTHDRVICEVFAQTTVLPLRFGTQFVSRERVQSHLQENCDRYQHHLAALAHQAEYGVTLIPKPITAPALATNLAGREYFLAKKQRLQALGDEQAQQQAELTAVIAAIQAHLDQSEINPIHHASSDQGERLYFLSPVAAHADLVQISAEWQALCPHWELTLGPPLPPYHFV